MVKYVGFLKRLIHASVAGLPEKTTEFDAAHNVLFSRLQWSKRAPFKNGESHFLDTII